MVSIPVLVPWLGILGGILLVKSWGEIGRLMPDPSDGAETSFFFGGGIPSSHISHIGSSCSDLTRPQPQMVV